jgi:SMC interacting uncharacterized protein involved in chromosome segregation
LLNGAGTVAQGLQLSYRVFVMSKERRTVSLEPSNNHFLSEHPNASDLIDELVSRYRQGGREDTVGIELRLQHKRNELEEKRQEVKRLEKEVSELEHLKREVTASESAQLREARAALDEHQLEPQNPAVQNWAEKLGIAPEQLIAKLDNNTP